MCLVDLVHNIWHTGENPQELGWTILVLIPKGTTDTIGIGMLETLWKVVEALIDTCLRASLQMNNILHGFRKGRGMGTAIMELKIAHDLARIDQELIFLVFLDLRKAYDTMDWDRLLITLEGYGAGPWLCGILETFWECQHVVPRKNGFHGTAFPATRVTTQGGLVSPMLFNVVADNFIRTWMAMMVEDQRMEHEDPGETIGRCLGVFYADNGMFGYHNSE